MNGSVTSFAESLAGWLADYLLLATFLLAAAFIAFWFVGQPKRRLVIAWVVLGELAVLGVVCSLPNWPRISLLPAGTTVTPASLPADVGEREVQEAGKPRQSSHPAAGAVDAGQPAVSKRPATIKVPSLRAIIGIGYLMGMATTSLWLVWGAIATLWICRRAMRPPDTLDDELARIVGDARPPRLLLCRQIGNAAAVGILRPTILLQTALSEKAPSHLLRAILAHEWAHVRNRDLWLLALERGLRILLFAHPLYWRLRSQIRQDQEAVADATAASAARHEYAQDLLEVARLSAGHNRLRAVGAVGIQEGSSQLSRRIAMLLDQTRHVQISVARPWKWRAAAGFVLLGAALSLMTVQPGYSESNAAANNGAQSRNSSKQTIKVHIFDVDGKPIGGAKVHASVWTEEQFPHNQDYRSDSAGVAVVELPKTMQILRIWTFENGDVPTFTHWEQTWFTAGHSAPDEVNVTLTKGTTIGGFVKNEQGQPIAGARVGVQGTFESDEQKQTSIDRWYADGDGDPVTNTNGQWTLNDVPEGKDFGLEISVTHPDYVSDLTWGGLQQSQNVTSASLHAQTATIIMKRGTRLTGVVTDPQGKGISGAVVIWGDDPCRDQGQHQEHSQEVRTDATGAYRLQPLPRMPLTVTVVAPGWMPELKKTTLAPENSTLDFQLKKGKTVRLRFVDSQGAPVPGVYVQIDGWRGCQSLYNGKPIVLDTLIPLTADMNGIYEWSWAPGDAVEYLFLKKGYRDIHRSVVAGDAEQTVQLDR